MSWRWRATWRRNQPKPSTRAGPTTPGSEDDSILVVADHWERDQSKRTIFPFNRAPARQKLDPDASADVRTKTRRRITSFHMANKITSRARLAVTHWRRRDSGSDGSWREQPRNNSDASEYAAQLADKLPASAHRSPCSSRLYASVSLLLSDGKS